MTKRLRLASPSIVAFLLVTFGSAICNFSSGGPLGSCNQPEDCGWGSYAIGYGASSYVCYQSMDDCCQCHVYDMECMRLINESTFTVKVKIPSTESGSICLNGECIGPK